MRSLRLLGPLSVLLLLAACSLDMDDPLTALTGPSMPRTSGLAVGDEPFAVHVGASVLASGGNAADAATAMYFALAVTYPVAAGLGGGGLCVVHDAKTGRNEQFDFLARDAGGGAYAVPGNVRGFAQLQAAYGSLSWQRVVAPAEGLAGGGFTISRALAVRLAAAQDVIRLDADMAAEFMDESGQVKKAGMSVSNADLAATLAAIRIDGAEAFYRGAVGAKIAAYAAAQGGAITPAQLAAYGVLRSQARAMQIGNQTVYLPAARTGAGAFAGAFVEDLSREGLGGEPQAATAAAVRQALAGFGVKTLPQDMGATGFATVDAQGQAVSCAVTMNGPFGSGHSAADTGVTLARAPLAGQTGLASAFLTPVIATDSGGTVSLAGAGAGGPNGTAAIGYALLRTASGEPLSRRGDMRSTGSAPYDTVNVIACSAGACFALPDPAANGMGAAADTGQ
jgi:gamma-glutamyltranspeptidase/glutathione hydrolase